MSDWRNLAACRDAPDAELWYPDVSDHEGEAAAKAECALCPVRQTCLEDALARGDQWGILGGLTADERASLKRREQRQAQEIRKRYCPRNHDRTVVGVSSSGSCMECARERSREKTTASQEGQA